MKKLIIVLLFFSYQNIICQEYSFNCFFQYKEASDGTINFHFINTKDDSYSLNGKTGYEPIYGRIFDSKKKVLHEYEVKNIKDAIQFKYLDTKKSNAIVYINIFSFELIETIIDSTKTEVKVIVFKNKKRKTIARKLEILFENSDTYESNGILDYYTHGTFKNSNIKINKGIPIRIKVDYMNGNKFTYNLIIKKVINTKLVVTEIK